MSLHFTSLNSGSNGNCYYIANEHAAVLIDAGLSCRETELRLQRLQLSMAKVMAIFISHEHSDHISGVGALARKYQIPVYGTPATFRRMRVALKGVHVEAIKAYEQVQIGGLAVTAFPKLHDAVDAHSFVVEQFGLRVGVFTDIGDACDNVIQYFAGCHAAILEANYDDELLENGSYPLLLKDRIRGGYGHLSNAKALELFLAYKPAYMSHLLLGHLSRENNNPALVQALFEQYADDTSISIASRYHESPVFTLTAVATAQ